MDRRLGLIFLALCLGCTSKEAATLIPHSHAVAGAALGMTETGTTPSPTPDNPDSDECDNCHGTGRSGDGLAKCQVCGGTGKKVKLMAYQPPVIEGGRSQAANLGQAIGIGAERAYSEIEAKLTVEQEKVKRLEAEIAALKAPKSTAVIYAWTECPSCPKIIADLKPYLEQSGWKVDVEYTRNPSPNTVYPWLKFCWEDKCVAVRPTPRTQMSRTWLKQKMNDAGLK